MIYNLLENKNFEKIVYQKKIDQKYFEINKIKAFKFLFILSKIKAFFFKLNLFFNIFLMRKNVK